MEGRIGHYSIVSELGRGGMGVVYKAHEESLNRFVALKVLGKHLSEDENFVERFKREARSAAALNHPNIVKVYAIDEFNGQHYFAMEYVEGSSILQIVKQQGPMAPVAAARLILQTASGLGAAHAKGILHRDIKPANLLLDEHGLVKIADFGLALLAAGNTRLTATGMFMGTPGYLSPEQCLGEGVDARTDIYSLGVTLYEMLTGVTPLNADSPLALLRQIIEVEPKDVAELRPEVPDTLRRILKKMMAKKPDDRYRDCPTLIADLQNWLASVGSTTSHLNPVITASAATVTSPGISDTATVLMDSAQSGADKITAGTRKNADRKPRVAMIAVISVFLLAAASYAAWYFGSADPAGDPTATTSEVAGVVADPGGTGTRGLVTGEEHPAATGAAATASDQAAPPATVEKPVEAQAATELKPTSGENLVETQTVTDANLDTGETTVGESTAGEIPEPRDYAQTDSSQNTVKVVPEGTRGSDYSPATAGVSLAATEQDTSQAPEQTMPAQRRPEQTVRDEPRSAPSNDRAANNSARTPREAPIGTGVALVSIGDRLLADAASDYIRQILERHSISVLDGIAVPGVAGMLENGGGAIEELLRPHARYLVFIRADYSGQRELYYMGRSDTEYQARLNVETHDMLDGRAVGAAIHASIGYTQLSVNAKVEEIIRPKFAPTAGNLKD